MKTLVPMLLAVASLSVPLASVAAGSALSAADTAAAFKAAGFTLRGGAWHSGCDDPGTPSYTPGAVETVRDLNGDGRPEAVITEGSAYCYGNTGTGFTLVGKQPDGTWKALYSEIGVASFLDTKGTAGWPDIEVGGPGFCFPVVRWNGKTYAQNRLEYEGKPCHR